MLNFIVRRLLLLLPVMFGILLITFTMTRLIPGDPCTVMLGEKATPEQCARFRVRFGLDDPIPIQFARYMANMARGDFGESFRTNQSITDIVLLRLPMTVELTICAMLFATTLGIFLGIVSAYWHNSAIDVLTMVGANFGVSMPVFWLGLMLAYLFALLLKGTPLWLPPSGRMTSGMTIAPLVETFNLQDLQGLPLAVVTFASNAFTFNALISGKFDVLLDAVRHLILPSMAVGTIPLAIIARMTRSSLLDVMGLDYIRTARAKGLKERLVIFRHALRNAMLPIATIIGLELGILFGGAVLTETIFSLAGVGRMLFEAITARDFPIVQGFTVVIAIAYVMVNLLVDISYIFIDPRIRLD